MKHSDLHSSAKAVIFLLVMLLAFVIFTVFYYYQDSIMESGNYQLYMVLSAVGAALLVGLVYLVSQSKHKVSAARRSASHSSRKKKKR